MLFVSIAPFCLAKFKKTDGRISLPNPNAKGRPKPYFRFQTTFENPYAQNIKIPTLKPL
nr:MAG TPA: hypothetical protein [Caudoviricetes sp.]